MKKLFLLLFAFAAIGVNAQVTPASTTTGTNSGDGEITAIITALNAADQVLQTADATDQGLNKLMANVVLLYKFSVGTAAATDTVIIASGGEYDPMYLGGTDTAKITQLIACLQTGEKVEGTDTVDVQVSWDVNLSDASPTVVNSTALGVTSITTGTSDTSFDNADIPPGVWVWGTIPATETGRIPVQVAVSVYGYWAD